MASLADEETPRSALQCRSVWRCRTVRLSMKVPLRIGGTGPGPSRSSIRKFLSETLPASLREISTAWQRAAECGKSRKIAFAMGPKTRRFDVAALVRAAATHAHVSIA